MKPILLALALVGFLLPFTPRAEAETEVSLNLFYDNLSPYGSWIEVGDYGYCFQPSVAVSNADWRPYSDGYWAYTDLGWTWVSYEDFGWATYHYGRWTELDSYGWVWVPGYEWGPAWVSWRTGGDYVGWAPLPPRSEVVYEGRAITGAVDVSFDIGPLYYNFVDIRYIGEPILRQRIVEPRRNVTIINRTVNVTNITYNNSVVYNYGPDYNRLNQYSSRPIQKLALKRETTVGGNLGSGKRGNFNRVSGNELMVVAPPIQKSQRKMAPRQVKAKVDKPKVERGWQGVQNRQQVEAEMKKENPKNIPPPSFQPQKNRQAEKAALPAQSKQAGESAPDVSKKEQKQERRAEKAEAREARQNEGKTRQRQGREQQQAQGQSQQENGSQTDRRGQHAAGRNARGAEAQRGDEPGKKNESGNDLGRNAEQKRDRLPQRLKQQAQQAPDQADQQAEQQRAQRRERRAQEQSQSENAQPDRAPQAQSNRARQAKEARQEKAQQNRQARQPEAQQNRQEARQNRQEARQNRHEARRGEQATQDKDEQGRKGKKKKKPDEQPSNP